MGADTPPIDTPAPEAPAQEPVSQAEPDMTALMSRMDELTQQVGSLSKPPAEETGWTGGISDLPYTLEEDAQTQDPNGFDPYGQDPYGQQGQYDQYGADPAAQQAQAQQALDQYISQAVQQGVQQHITPFIQQQKAAALEQKYPDLADPAKAAEVVKATAQYAQRLGRPELARDPELVELVHLAQQARDRASQQTAADGGADIHLEGSGAAPQATEMDAGDQMLARFGIDPNNPYG